MLLNVIGQCIVDEKEKIPFCHNYPDEPNNKYSSKTYSEVYVPFIRLGVFWYVHYMKKIDQW